MTKKQFGKTVKEIKELTAARDILDRQIEERVEYLKEEMEKKGQYIHQGDDWKLSWKLVESMRFNQGKLKEEDPELYKKYCRLTSSRRLLIE